MACCKTVSERKTGKAVISCFVKHDGSIYAVVCRHVTSTARDSFFVNDMKSPFARIMRENMKNVTEKFTDNDIDLVEVTTEIMRKKCKPVFRNAKGIIKRGRIFMGKIEDLLSETVFQCNKTDTEGRCNSTFGKILPLPKINGIIQNTYCMEKHFVVGETDFAEAGDSGRIVAYEAKDGDLDLVGIIIHKNDEQTVCLLLRDGLEYLKQKYGLELNPDNTPYQASDSEGEVEPGQIMTFNV